MKSGVIQNQNGQLIIEAVLLMIVLMSLTILVSRQFREKHLLADIVEGPWAYVQGMAECGVWAPPKQACTLHPNLIDRHIAVGGEQM